jgi:hypothetical protein
MSKFIDNTQLHNIYNKLKYNILGSKTKEDAYSLLEKYKLDTKGYNLMISLINGKKYDHALDNENMKKYIRDIAACRYKEDSYELISQILLQTSDIAQVRTFTRIADMKQNKPQYVSMKELRQTNKENTVTKKCPHCGYKCLLNRLTTYVVCGYGESGYDWEGCGKDWCFRCGKMLCKTWEQDQLYLPTNRFHDSKCCRKHAIIYGYKYPENYCKCRNIFVCRDN